jgi:hypothetical protein
MSLGPTAIWHKRIHMGQQEHGLPVGTPIFIPKGAYNELAK